MTTSAIPCDDSGVNCCKYVQGTVRWHRCGCGEQRHWAQHPCSDKREIGRGPCRESMNHFWTRDVMSLTAAKPPLQTSSELPKRHAADRVRHCVSQGGHRQLRYSGHLELSHSPHGLTDHRQSASRIPLSGRHGYSIVARRTFQGDFQVPGFSTRSTTNSRGGTLWLDIAHTQPESQPAAAIHKHSHA